MKDRVTIEDIVQRTGISKSTVSRVLTGKGYVSDEVRNTVKKAASELEYVPQKRHNKNVNDMVMIVSCQLDSDAQIKLCKSISTSLQENGFKCVVASVEFGSNTIYDYLDYAYEKHFGGLIILGALETKELRYSLMNIPCPVVLLNQSLSGIPTCSIILEDKKAGYDATKYLIDKGHKKILFITGYDNATAIIDREKGFLQAMKEAGIDAEKLILRTDFTKENSEKIAYQLIKDSFPYTALLCATDELLSGILKVFKKEKIQMPDQISVMSFENTLLTEIYEPKISVVSYDFIEIGKQMADLLIERAAKPYHKTKSIHRTATLLLRDSVKAVK